jgi:hypothetical protein
LTEIAAEKNSTIVFPLPLEILQGFFSLPATAGERNGTGADGNVPRTPASA